MKKLPLLLPVLLLLSFNFSDTGITKKDRKFAMTYLQETRDDLINTIAELNEEQFNFKPADNRWSIRECLQHIALSEAGLWQFCDATLKAPANAEKRADIKVTDEQLVAMITDRTKKREAAEQLKPSNAASMTAIDALNAFKSNREKLIKYMKNTKDDMRNHVAETQMGPIDAYQIVLLIASHSNRHTQQIAEVKAAPNFPK